MERRTIIEESISNKKTLNIRNDDQKITGLIISAGLSSRLGEYKPLLKYKNKSFITRIIENLQTVCEQIIVVTGFNAEQIQKHIQQNFPNSNSYLKIVFNSEFENGMYSSIKKGIEHLRNSDWIIFHQVDQPNLPVKFYSDLIKQINKNYNWIQPKYKGQKGHPILFDKKVEGFIRNSDIGSNLREISNEKDLVKYFWECNYSEILTDIDTPRDFNKLK